MLDVGAAPLCSKGCKLVYLYGKLCGLLSVPTRSGPACASATAAKVCSDELSMLELGSMKKDLILSTLTVSRSM